jgi:heat shock protein HslJ
LLAAVAVAVALVGACGEDSNDSAAPVSSDGGAATSAPPADGGGGTVTAADLEGRTFVSTSVEGHDLVEGTTISIGFSDGRLSANAGCNTLGAPATIEDGALVPTGPLATTEMACEPALMAQDEWLAALLGAGPTVRLDGDELTLDGGDAGSITLLDREVAEPDLPIEGTQWVVDGIVANDAVSSLPVGVTASLTIEGGTAMVETGCNSGSGSVEVGDDTLTFGPLAITLRACEPEVGQVEQAVLLTLSDRVDYEIDSDRLSLRRDTADGVVGLELVAQP